MPPDLLIALDRASDTFPNDVRFWSFNDDGHFDWGEAARQANRIRPPCS